MREYYLDTFETDIKLNHLTSYWFIQSILCGLFIPDLPFTSFYRSVLILFGAIISNKPNFYGTYPNLRIFLYFNTRAKAIKSSSSEYFFLFSANLSFMILTSSWLSKSGGSTISTISSIRDCFTISSMR